MVTRQENSVRLLQSAFNGRYPQDQFNAPFRIDHPLGACFLIKRTAYEQCGGFNENIFMYSEEINLALRYSLRGWECWRNPPLRSCTSAVKARLSYPTGIFGELWRSRLFIYDTYYTPLAAFSLRALLAAAMLKNILSSMLAQLLGRENKQRTRSRIRKWTATLRMAVSH